MAFFINHKCIVNSLTAIIFSAGRLKSTFHSRLVNVELIFSQLSCPEDALQFLSLKFTCWDCKRKFPHHKLKETPFLFLLLLLHYIAGPISTGSCESPKCKCVWKRLHMCMANGVIHNHSDSCDFLLRKSVHHWLPAATMAAHGRIAVYSTHYWRRFSAPSFSVTR